MQVTHLAMGPVLAVSGYTLRDMSYCFRQAPLQEEAVLANNELFEEFQRRSWMD